MRDWVPMVFYGDTFTLMPNSAAYVILYPIPDFALGDQEFLVEDEDETGLFIERIVGDIHMWCAEDDYALGAWRLMPLGVDYEATTVLEPFTTDWSPNSSEWANLRWWDGREYICFSSPELRQPNSVDHPAWTHVDIKPRQLMGSGRNLWPIIAVRNFSSSADLIIRHKLRAYYK